MINGECLKKLREEAGLSQQEVARLAGISQAHVAKIENGKVDPRLSTVNRMLFVLKRNNKSRTCGDIMKTNIVSASPDDPLEKVIKTMREMGISQLPVFQGTALVGSITENTILPNFNRKIKSLQVKHVLDRPFPVVSPSDSIEMLPALLEFHQAVLVSEKGKIKGIITKSDLLDIK